MKYIALFLSLMSFTLAQDAPDTTMQNISVEEILDTIVDSQRGGQTVSSTITMQVIRPDETKEYVIESVSDGEEKSLIRVVEPRRDAGQAFLQDGDNLYLYNPRLRRTLRLPPSGRSDSFLGSDMSFNDISGRDFQEDYEVALTAQDEESVTLSLKPKELAPTPYGQIIVVADRTRNYAPLEFSYFDQREQAVRQIIFADYLAQDAIFFPQRLEIIDLLNEGNSTVIIQDALIFGDDVPERCFSQRALESGC